MYKRRFETNSDTALLATLDDGVKRYSVGKTLLRRLADESGATRKLGRSWRFRVDVLDAYIEAQNGGAR